MAPWFFGGSARVTQIGAPFRPKYFASRTACLSAGENRNLQVLLKKRSRWVNCSKVRAISLEGIRLRLDPQYLFVNIEGPLNTTADDIDDREIIAMVGGL